MKAESTNRPQDNQTPKPEPPGPERPAPGRRELKLEAEERTPEEAGYGYGV
jgi:hypothetical protein